MSAPRTKRQFAGAASDPAQRQITSFFTSSSTNPNTSSSSTGQLARAPESQPTAAASTLPPSVQSNLISVGMRVRKSVPEGYKTGSYSAFALWDDASSTPPPPPHQHSAIDDSLEFDDDDDAMTNRSRANAISGPRELLPFCGLHKVGGMAPQPGQDAYPTFSINALGTATYADQDMGMGLHDVPGLTSSQDSITSTASSRKRSFTEDEDELRIPTHLNLWDGEVSPRTTGFTTASANANRVLAVPRGKRSKLNAQGPGQENVMVLDADFEEADFLADRRSWEVDMSDV
ncbi:ribonucleotide reductase inhibitor-domain-containing protein [Xylariomycetidae sp. FL0641]|nr:ribonucleotide reductase inhibitor-domain-containing protein [Xylariomycetidae sp. FL0641]